MDMKLYAASDMGIGPALITAVLGYAVVFFGLVLLMWVVQLLGRVMTRAKAAPAAAPAAPAEAPSKAEPAPKPEARGTAGTILLHDVPERDAALVMAVVAHQLGKPLNQLRFKSIREVKDHEV